MKRRLTIAALVLGLAVGAVVAEPTPEPAEAWSFGVDISAECDRATGEWVLTRTIDNTGERQKLILTQSNPQAPFSEVPARSTESWTERVPGSTQFAFVSATGYWPSDTRARSREDGIKLEDECSPPPTTTTTTTLPTTTTTSTTAPPTTTTTSTIPATTTTLVTPTTTVPQTTTTAAVTSTTSAPCGPDDGYEEGCLSFTGPEPGTPSNAALGALAIALLGVGALLLTATYGARKRGR